MAKAQVDPDIRVPAAVRAAAARVKELHDAAYATDSQGEPTDAPGADGEQPEEEQHTQEQASAAETAPVTPEGSPQPEDEQSWAHKYRSLKGRFDRQQVEMRSMSQQIAELQSLVTARGHTEQSEELPSRLITDEEERDYGTDFLNVVGKKAKEEFMPELNSFRQQMDAIRQQLSSVTGTITLTARQQMEKDLDSSLPEWRKLNFDEGFLDWLGLPDTYSGAIRHGLLKAAYERNDTPRVLAFFRGFLAEEAATAPQVAEPELQADPSAGKIPLESLAAPGRAKTAAAGAPAEKPFISRTQIQQFYADVAAGKYRGKDAEKKTLEAMIFEAQRDGRIR